MKLCRSCAPGGLACPPLRRDALGRPKGPMRSTRGVVAAIAVLGLAHCAAPGPHPVPIEDCSVAVRRAPASTDSTIYQWYEATPAPTAAAVVLPQYPARLRHGSSGRVVLLAVVDTAGRIEPGSVQVDSASDTAFVAPSVHALANSVYCPGLVAGRRVRVRIRIPMNYATLRVLREP